MSAVRHFDGSAHQRKRFAFTDRQVRPVDRDTFARHIQKTEGCRRYGTQYATLHWIGIKELIVAKFDEVRCRYMKCTRQIQGRIRPENHPRRIQEVKVCTANGRPQQSIDVGNVAARDPTDYILNRITSGKCSAFPGVDVKFIKTEKKITAVTGFLS